MKGRIISVLVAFFVVMSVTSGVFAAPIVSWPGNSIAITAPYNIIVDDAGNAYISSQFQGLTKYKADGTVDLAFGTNGGAAMSYMIYDMCFDANGNVLTGDGSAAAGVICVSALDGSEDVLIPNVIVRGIDFDSSGNLIINDGTNLTKYSGTSTTVLWTKPLSSPNQVDACIVPDGSIYTEYSTGIGGIIVKYTADGDLDTSFGTNGLLTLDSNCVFLNYSNGYIYTGCPYISTVVKVSLDGTSFIPFMYSPWVTVFYPQKDAYFTLDAFGDICYCYTRLYLEPTDTALACQVTPDHLTPGSSDTVNLAVTSTISADYGVKAVVYNAANGQIVPEITSSQSTLADGAATLTLTPPETGWPAGKFNIDLVFVNAIQMQTPVQPSRLNPTVNEFGTFRVPTQIQVIAQHTVTFKSAGSADIVKIVNDGNALTDIPAVPEKTGYTGAWDIQDFSSVTNNLVVNAVYTINSYTVTFKDWAGATIGTQSVQYGKDATAPTVPERPGFLFNGWDGSLLNVTQDRTLNAVYSAAPTATPTPAPTATPTATPTPTVQPANTVTKTGETAGILGIAAILLLMLGLATFAVIIYRKKKHTSK